MASIYGNSYVTIAAASAIDSQGGCFSLSEALLNDGPSSSSHGSVGFHVLRVATSYSDVVAIYLDSPLNQRAWILQEMTLSPRMVFFTSEQIYWMCSERVVSEDGFYGECNSVIRRPIAIEASLRGSKKALQQSRDFDLYLHRLSNSGGNLWKTTAADSLPLNMTS
jgi:hypothetical protein